MANPRRGRPCERVVLSPTERARLEQWVRRRTTAQGLAQRARIVLACATGRPATEIGRELHVTRLTVGRWRRRFLARRLDGLLDDPRPGAPRRITDAMVERVITDTLEKTPRDATHWSTRSMAHTAGLSQSAVARIWKAFALQPHRVETFKLSKTRRSFTKAATSGGSNWHHPSQRRSWAVAKNSRFKP